jgi:hypothetical protein
VARALGIITAPLEPLRHVADLLSYHTRPRAAAWGRREPPSPESLRALVERLEGK